VDEIKTEAQKKVFLGQRWRSAPMHPMILVRGIGMPDWLLIARRQLTPA